MTVVGVGEIAFVAAQADNSGGGFNGDAFQFVLLVPVTAGTVIYFTENGYRTDTSTYRTNEGLVRWTAQSDLQAGTVVTLLLPGGTAIASTREWTFVNPSTGADLASGTFALAGGGDNITALNSISFGGVEAMTGTAIAAITFGGTTFAANWTNAAGNTSTALPPGLTDGVNAVSVGVFDNVRYSEVAAGPETGTLSTVRNAINTDSYWSGSTVPLNTFSHSTGTFTITGGGAPTLSINDISISEGDGGTSMVTFTITRSDNITEVTFDITTADGTATTADGDYFEQAYVAQVLAAGGPLTQTYGFTIAGDTITETNETFFVNLTNVTGATVSDGQGQATILNDDFALIRIYTIQGAGHSSAFAGQSVSTTGVVTAVDSNGFYLQDASGDGVAATSDAIFVFTSTAPTVSVGNEIRLTATVSEFLQGGNAQRLTVTQLSAPTNIVVLNSNVALPAAILIGPDGVQPPSENIEDDGFTQFQPDTDGLDFWESLEGMRVTIQDPIAVSGNNSFNEFYTVTSRDGADVAATGYNATTSVLTIEGAITGGVGVNNSIGGDFNPEKVQIQIDTTVTPGGVPTVAPGTRYNDVTGVVNYSAGAYEVIASSAVTVAAASTNTVDNTTLLGSTARLTIGSYNAENLDPGDGAARFTALARDIGFALGAPGIVVLDEIQDNNGATNDSVVSASMTLQMLVDAIFTETGVQYSWIDNPFITDDRNGGEPGGNIRVAMLFRTDTVSLVTDSVRTVTDPTDQATNSANPFFGARLPLAADFVFNGSTVTVVGNHFTSKGGSSPLQGAIQPSTNEGEARRAGQADLVNDFVDTILAGNASANIVVAGDLNDFQTEEPLRILTGQLDWTGSATTAPAGPQVLENLSFLLPREERFSYIFEGNAQQIDHILVSNALSDGARFDIVHRNTLFGEINSDHDALVASIVVGRAETGTAGVDSFIGGSAGDVYDGGAGNDRIAGKMGNDELRGGDGDDFINGGSGADLVDGGAGNDLFLINEAGDRVIGGDGRDEVYSYSQSFVLADDVELVTYYGPGSFTGTGNALANGITGSVGSDILLGLGGDDILSGRGGTDDLQGGDGTDRLFGGDGNDALLGGADTDYLYGDDGADQLLGGTGDDTLYGGGADDLVNGGAGRDFLFGNAGADNFVFSSVGDSSGGFDGGDWIFDFDGAAGDRIDLSAIDAIAGGADDAFAFIGTNAFGNVAGQLRIEVLADRSFVLGDVDGDGVADFFIRLDATVPLNAGDFIL